ncbi:hypothetical protein JSY14_07275 [Brachybacterium sp. EF45031]|uniref:hypothetical protein n=1 Tax=Brachybacterium sillae TaxID=2810536 RepID=UPI00217EBCE6|nr:hypothetical protein [Brachybacterium sillae]MCS6711831.1 hypothetical protein [Brachybacterium sillae]
MTQRIEAAGGALTLQAEEQDGVSAVNGGVGTPAQAPGGGTGASGPGGAGSFPWGMVKDAWILGWKIPGLLSATGKAVDGITDLRHLRSMLRGPGTMVEDLTRFKELMDLRRSMMATAEAARIDDFARAVDWAQHVKGLDQLIASDSYGKLTSKSTGMLSRLLDQVPGMADSALGQAKALIPSKAWEKLGGVVDRLPSQLYNSEKLLGTLAEKIGPDALKGLGSAGIKMGKFLPGLDIVAGGIQIATADTGYDKVSGGLAVAGGALMLAGLAFPPAAAVGVVLAGSSVAMDVGKYAGNFIGKHLMGNENFDLAKSVDHAVSDAAHKVGEGVAQVGEALKDLGGAARKRLGSLFG